MEDINAYQELDLTEEQVETLSRIVGSFEVGRFGLRALDGHASDHTNLIAAHAHLLDGAGGSFGGEWLIRADGEVISRAGAAASPGDWLREGQEAI